MLEGAPSAETMPSKPDACSMGICFVTAERASLEDVGVDLVGEEHDSSGTYKPTSLEERVGHMAEGTKTVAPKGEIGGNRKGREGVTRHKRPLGATHYVPRTALSTLGQMLIVVGARAAPASCVRSCLECVETTYVTRSCDYGIGFLSFRSY